MSDFQTFSHKIDHLAVEMMRRSLPLRALNLNFLTAEEQARIKEVFDHEEHVRGLYINPPATAGTASTSTSRPIDIEDIKAMLGDSGAAGQ